MKAVVKNVISERRYLDSAEFMSHEIIAEIIKDLFRMVMYNGTESLDIPGSYHMTYLEKSLKKI
jgi:hypothetical protein